MTTELPSGETFTAVKLTELKNSSSVSRGFAACALANIEADTRERSRIDRRIIDRRIEVRRMGFSSTVFKILSSSLRRRGLRVPQRLIQRLVVAYVLLHHPPAVVIATACHGRTVVHSAVVERRAHRIDRYPTPGELDVGKVACLADSGNIHEFAARDLDRHRSIAGQHSRNQGPYR